MLLPANLYYHNSVKEAQQRDSAASYNKFIIHSFICWLFTNRCCLRRNDCQPLV